MRKILNKRVLVVILALLLSLSVVGGAFALYIKEAQKTINVGKSQGLHLLIDLGENVDSIALTGLNPDTPKTHDLTLKYSAALQEGETVDKNVRTTFKVTLSGDLAQYVTYKATTSNGTEFADQAALTEGKTIKLGAIPKDLKLEFALTDAAKRGAASDWAEKAASIDITWLVDKTTPDGFYIVGKIEGKENWGVSFASPYGPPITAGENIAEIKGVMLKAGDLVKMVYASGGVISQEGGWKSFAATSYQFEGFVTDESGNLKITTDGTYSFYFKNDNGQDVVFVAKDS